MDSGAPTTTGRAASCACTVDVGHRPRAGQQRRLLRESLQQPGDDRVELTDVPERERAQERAQRGRRRTPSKSRPTAPCRSRSMSSIESAPAAISATSAVAFTEAFGEATVKRSASRSDMPARPARAHDRHSPAHDTRFASPKTASISAAALDRCISRMPFSSADLEP